MKSLLTFLILAIAFNTYSQPKQSTGSITVDGRERTFVTYVPVINAINYKPPVLIALHGGFGTGRGMVFYADFRPEADKDKFIFVCPDGIERSWNDGRESPANKRGINDVKFIDHLISYIIKTCHADSSRVYITGMSNGGFMTSRLACELYDRIAAIAVVGASMDIGQEPNHALPVMYIQGTDDPLVPFGGGEITKGAGGMVYSHQEIVQKWMAIDKCDPKPVITNLPVVANDGTSVTEEEYSGPGGLKVVSYTLNGAGHAWPDTKIILPRFFAGKPCDNLDACKVIWDFLKNYSKNQTAR
jgi:polyhydroxybutyrate depolymerase